MGVALVSLDVSGGGTYVSLTPFHIGEAGSDGGQTNNNNKQFSRFLIFLLAFRSTELPVVYQSPFCTASENAKSFCCDEVLHCNGGHRLASYAFFDVRLPPMSMDSN